MKKITYLLSNYPVSCLLITLIWVICLIPIPEMPLSQVGLINKWTHLVMFGGLCLVLCLEYRKRHRRVDRWRAFVGMALLPWLMGGLIELAQAYLTGGRRSGDWLDFAADGVGVAIGCLIGMPLARCLSRANKDI